MHRLLRVISVGLLLAAILPRASDHHRRLLVVAVDGAIERGSENGGATQHGGAIAALIGSGMSVDLYGWQGQSPASFWATVFGGSTALPNDVVEPLPYTQTDLLWATLAREGRRSMVFGLPGIDTSMHETNIRVAGVPLSSQFLGGSYGTIADAARIAAARLPWPYREVGDRVRQVTRSLARGRWSSWLSVRSGERDGLFKIYRSLSGRYYLTPCYETAPADGRGDAPRQYQQPAWPGDVDAPRALFGFAQDLSERPFRFARAQLDQRWDLFVYFDSLPGAVDRIGAAYRDTVRYADLTDRERVRLQRSEGDAYRRFDDRLAAMVSAAGPDACVAVVIDLEADADANDVEQSHSALPESRMILTCGGRLHGQARASTVDVAPTLAYLLGAPAPSGAEGTVIREVAEQIGRPVSRAPARVATESGSEGVTLTAAALIELGESNADDAEVSSGTGDGTPRGRP